VMLITALCSLPAIATNCQEANDAKGNGRKCITLKYPHGHRRPRSRIYPC
jgi:hypothetical protein